MNNEYPVLSNGGDFVTQPSCRMWSSMSINSSPRRLTDPNYISKSCILCSLDWLRVYENNNGDLTIWCHDDSTVVARIWYFSLAIQPRKLDCCSPSFKIELAVCSYLACRKIAPVWQWKETNYSHKMLQNVQVFSAIFVYL